MTKEEKLRKEKEILSRGRRKELIAGMVELIGWLSFVILVANLWSSKIAFSGENKESALLNIFSICTGIILLPILSKSILGEFPIQYLRSKVRTKQELFSHENVRSEERR